MVDSSTPGNFKLVLVPNPDAPRELQIIGEQYWEHNGLHPIYGTIHWNRKASEIDHTSWANSLYHAAAAGVSVSLPKYSCMQCQGDLTLSSRAGLETVAKGEKVKCRDCTPNLNKYVEKVLHPHNQANQRKNAERKREQELQREAAEELETARKRAIEFRYPSETANDGGYVLAHASIKAKLGALTALHVTSAEEGLIQSFKFSDESIASDSRLFHELFVAAWHADLLLIHPSTSPDAFIWDEQDPAKLGDEVYLERARFIVPGDGALGARRELFIQELREQLRVESLLSEDRKELQRLLHRLMIKETVRYLIFCFSLHHLPAPADHHLERLQSYLEKAVEKTSLGILFRIAWTAARDAISASTRHPMSKDSVAAHGVNKVVHYIERIIKDPEEFDTPHNEDTRLPLSEATRIIFNLILELPPMTASPKEIAEILAGASDEELLRNCDNLFAKRKELLAWLEKDSTWSPQQFRSALESVSASDYEVCIAGCAHEGGPSVATRTLKFYDRFIFEGNEKLLALLAAEATDIGNSNSWGSRAGDFVLAEVVEQLKRTQRSKP
ncbi:hypothetical protein CDES_12720 [Corynebacterium deserti GIMN1.010]|uniref:Uncharacterized protein n=1 Tax=Corynebacterium deserti GIMN1.010 TaxID=931089 RepID=A0A0M4CLA4_9CORY|nr:hypothetical protein [Corynebacterium deserti]ALC06888.1 hypothetical protein CDES_12720 [Corynebacterium deserti GIMN1.010]